MRITSGQFRGRILKSPEGLSTRPTSDRARQAVFNILMHASWGGASLLDGAAVIDIFAGTGALGLEALSRGAADAVFIEQARPALTALQENITACRATNRARVIAGAALAVPPKPADLPLRNLVFCDPPYNTATQATDLGRHAIEHLARNGWLADDVILVMEMAKKFPEQAPDGYAVLDERSYGVALVRFLSRRDAA